MEQAAMEQLREQAQVVAQPLAKAGIVIGGAATSYSLQEWSHVISIAAGSAAFVYSICLLVEWWWKRMWKPLLVWLARRRANKPLHTEENDG
jgi:hypothetical protein